MVVKKEEKKCYSQHDEYDPIIEYNESESMTVYVPNEFLDVRAFIDRIMTGQAVYQPKEGVYSSVTNLDYQEALETVAEAEQAFDSLPIELRQRFGSPEQFLEFVDDPANFQEAMKLGLIDPEVISRMNSVQEENEELMNKNEQARDGVTR